MLAQMFLAAAASRMAVLCWIPLFTRRTVLVGAHASGIDHHQIAVETGGNRCQQFGLILRPFASG
jgi:hypothetical protein